MSGSPNRVYRLWRAYRLRLKRRYFLARAIRRRRQLTEISNQTGEIRPDDILCFLTVRNELPRLPAFLEHHRRLGVSHFLVVDNASDDGSGEYLRDQPDVSLWHTRESYKNARFGVDWMTYLHFRYGHGHWCLTLDADEMFIYPDWEAQGLPALTAWLDGRGFPSMGALMLDLYPKGRLDERTFTPGQDPLEVVNWFDADNFTRQPREELGSAIVRGGVRARAFFAESPERAPTMNKVPLIKWNRRYAYLTSTHVVLPARLNRFGQDDRPSGALLHTKFLPSIVEKATEEKYRAEHFSNGALYEDYYDALATGEPLWFERSHQLTGWRQLVDLKLMSGGAWWPEKSKPDDEDR